MDIENQEKYCFPWSIQVLFHVFENSHPQRVPNYTQSFAELNIQGFNFTNRFKCSDVYVSEIIVRLSINIFELDFYHIEEEWKYKLSPTEKSKKVSDRVVDL